MKLSLEEFRAWPEKRVTLMGMSGVGKTRLANILRQQHWFHYSVDYRIGTRYLDEAILDNIKLQATQIPFLRDLLRSDSIYFRNNITVDHLKPLSAFLGKVGNPELGGLTLREFKRRQQLHRQAEIAALKDVPAFIGKARKIYGYEHFVNDSGGSICEVDDPQVLEVLSRHTLIVYIEATEGDRSELMRRAERDPKPLYYRESFLDEQLRAYMEKKDLPYVAMIEPDDFVRCVFPKLVAARLPRYRAMADRYGYTVASNEMADVRDKNDFLSLLEQALSAQLP